MVEPPPGGPGSFGASAPAGGVRPLRAAPLPRRPVMPLIFNPNQMINTPVSGSASGGHRITDAIVWIMSDDACVVRIRPTVIAQGAAPKMPGGAAGLARAL